MRPCGKILNPPTTVPQWKYLLNKTFITIFTSTPTPNFSIMAAWHHEKGFKNIFSFGRDLKLSEKYNFLYVFVILMLACGKIFNPYTTVQKLNDLLNKTSIYTLFNISLTISRWTLHLIPWQKGPIGPITTSIIIFPLDGRPLRECISISLLNHSRLAIKELPVSGKRRQRMPNT